LKAGRITAIFRPPIIGYVRLGKRSESSGDHAICGEGKAYS
jgi:hypothetical protein